MLKIINFFFILLSFQLVAEEHKVSFKQDNWQNLEYSSIPANKVDFGDKLIINVDSSSAPLIYPLESFLNVSSFIVSGKIEGSLNLKEDKVQGDKKNDDFLFRIGLVYEGKKKLGGLKRAFAVKWVKTLFDLNKTNSGISHIEFFNIYSDDSLKGKRRDHPASKYLKENFVFDSSSDGSIEINHKVKLDKKVVAIWISSDGDDTKSKFKVILDEIKLIYKKEEK